MSDYDYVKYEEMLQRHLDEMWRDPEELEIGENISNISEIKIIFDGYGDLETEDEYIEGGNHSMMSFAVFVHKDSLNGSVFPEHEQTPWALVHRPKDEVCIWVWYDADKDEVEVVPFEDGSTEMDHEEIYRIIDKLDEGEYEE